MTLHLSHAQLCDLLLETSPESSAAGEHLRKCKHCATALQDLQQTLSLFRDTATSLALNAAACRRPVRLPSALLQVQTTPPQLHLRSFAWASAVLLLCASTLPLALHHHPAAATSVITARLAQPLPDLSDDALLDQVDQDLALSVPTPLQPLADPTVRHAFPATEATERTN